MMKGMEGGGGDLVGQRRRKDLKKKGVEAAEQTGKRLGHEVAHVSTTKTKTFEAISVSLDANRQNVQC